MKACDAVQELLTAHALGALGASEASLVDEHLAGCLVCQGAQVLAQEALCFVEAPAVAPPPAVWAGVQAKIAKGRAGDDPVREAPTAVVSVSCSFCRGGLVRPEAVYCASCLSPHHPDCFEDHGRCSVMGCGETRVVRPADMPPLEEVLDARRRYRASRRLRRNWLLGGIAILAGGSLAALSGTAELLADPAPAVAQAAPSVTPSPAPAPSVATRAPLPAQRFDVRVADATLAEVVEGLSAASGAQVLLPPTLKDVLVRERTWQGATWSRVLEDLAAELDLVCETQDAGALAVLLPGESAEGLERAGRTIDRHRSWWLASYADEVPVELAADLSGPRQLAVTSSALALAVGRELRVYRIAWVDGEQAVDGPLVRMRLPERVRALAWNPAGDRLAFLVGPASAPSLAVLVLDDDPRLTEQGRVTRLGDLAWLASDALVISHAEGIDEVLLEAGEVATRATRGLPFQTAQLADGRLWIERPDAQELWGSLEAERALAFRPGAFRVVVAASGAPVGDWIEAPSGWGPDPRAWPVALRPDGRCLAWVSGPDAWSLLRLDGEHEPFARDVPRGDDPAWPNLSWSSDGGELAVWRGDRLATWSFEPGGCIVGLVDDPDARRVVESGADLGDRFDQAVGFGERVLLVTRQAEQRDGRVEVVPLALEPIPATPARTRPAQVDLDLSGRDLGATWRPRHIDEAAPEERAFPGEQRPLPSPQPERVEPGPRTQLPQPGETPANPDPAPEVELAESAPDGAADDDQPAAPRVDLTHVARGQRWVFRHGQGGIDEVWQVEGVGIDEVHVRRQFRLEGRPVGESELRTWRPQNDEGARALSRGAARGDETREALEIEGLGSLPCAVVRVEGVETWRALGGDVVTFPGAVREVRAGTEQRRLVRVEAE